MSIEIDNSDALVENSRSFMPRDATLPFFAYGIFQPGELAFLQIKEFVRSWYEIDLSGVLRVRDGLPIASINEEGCITGTLLVFDRNTSHTAYRRIADLEPTAQYRWGTTEFQHCPVNILIGRSPKKGSVIAEDLWNGRDDPLFTSALEVIEETLDKNREWSLDLKPLFRLEMAYLLLWSSIERYASLRYHLRDRATHKIYKIASESAFGEAIRSIVSESRFVQRADDPTKKCVLDPNDPEKTLEYYYQIRSNLVHRGKGVALDHERLMKSLEELLAIFRATLTAAFEESQRPVGEQ